MPSTQDFWAPKGQMNDEEPATPSEVAALRAFVEHRSKVTPTINALFTIQQDEHDLEGKLSRIAVLIEEIISTFPEEHERMVDLVAGIRELNPDSMGLSDLQKQEHPEWYAWGPSDTVENHLQDMRETHQAHRFKPVLDEGETLEDRMAAYRNSNRFFAAFFSRTGNLYDLERGITHIRDILETDLEKHEISEYSGTPPNQWTQLDCDIPAAVQYLLIDGKEIYGRIDQNAFMRSIPLEGGKTTDLWKGKPGFSAERWHFWKDRLVWVSQQSEVLERTRAYAKAAVKEMNRVEEELKR